MFSYFFCFCCSVFRVDSLMGVENLVNCFDFSFDGTRLGDQDLITAFQVSCYPCLLFCFVQIQTRLGVFLCLLNDFMLYITWWKKKKLTIMKKTIKHICWIKSLNINLLYVNLLHKFNRCLWHVCAARNVSNIYVACLLYFMFVECWMSQ